MKLVRIIGKPIKTDKAAAMKELLSYAHILIEIDIDQELPETLCFENDRVVLVMSY